MPEITTPDPGLVAFRQDVHKLLRRRVLEAMEIVLEEELSEALGSSRYERSESRRGYRNGSEKRTVTTSLGAEEIEIPRGRVFRTDGETTEFQSELLPRYARRTQAVDDAVLGSKHLSKSAVSRVVSRLKNLFAAWSERDLSEETYPILYLDGLQLKVRLAGLTLLGDKPVV